MKKSQQPLVHFIVIILSGISLLSHLTSSEETRHFTKIQSIESNSSSIPLRITFNNTLVNTKQILHSGTRRKHKRPTPRYIREKLSSSSDFPSFPWKRIARKITNGLGVSSMFGTSLTMDSAMTHLQTLKDKLLSYYAQKSLEIGTGRDGIGFPSLEGALLSLAFLTFAVFLIDLVQTLLSRLRGNPVQYVNNGGRRKRREIRDRNATISTLTTSQILSSIERPILPRNLTEYGNPS